MRSGVELASRASRAHSISSSVACWTRVLGLDHAVPARSYLALQPVRMSSPSSAIPSLMVPPGGPIVPDSAAQPSFGRMDDDRADQRGGPVASVRLERRGDRLVRVHHGAAAAGTRAGARPPREVVPRAGAGGESHRRAVVKVLATRPGQAGHPGTADTA